jgi:hypothetical protein
MKRLLIVLALLLLPIQADADTFASYGLGVFGSASTGRSETKVVTFGHEHNIFDGPFIWQYEVGGFNDSGGNGRKGSGFGNISGGLEATPGYFVLRSLWGVAGITTTDTELGGHFQFNQDLLVGVKDSRGVIFGLDYKHMSSAGFERPNRGRDLMMLHLEFPW